MVSPPSARPDTSAQPRKLSPTASTLRRVMGWRNSTALSRVTMPGAVYSRMDATDRPVSSMAMKLHTLKNSTLAMPVPRNIHRSRRRMRKAAGSRSSKKPTMNSEVTKARTPAICTGLSPAAASRRVNSPMMPQPTPASSTCTTARPVFFLLCLMVVSMMSSPLIGAFCPGYLYIPIQILQ